MEYFTAKEVDELEVALNDVWNIIAFDVLGNEYNEMDRDKVFASVIDADRPVSLGGISHSLYEKLINAPEIVREQIKKEIFPYNSYCI